MQLKVCQDLISQALAPSVAPLRFQMAGQLLKPSATLSPEDRLLIYRHNITAAQQHVLQMVYPVCLKILGEACFNTLTKDYAWTLQSNCHDLNQYGLGFADFLEVQLQLHPALNELAYLPDLARLEWAWHQSLFAKDDLPFDHLFFQILVGQHGDKLQAELSHSLIMLSSPWPVYDLWHAHTYAPPLQPFAMPDNTQYLLIYRSDSVMMQQVSVLVYQLLQYSREGLTLCNIADMLGDKASETFEHLPMLIQKGWVTGFCHRQDA